MTHSNFDLDTPLLSFTGEDPHSAFSIRSAVEGAIIFGNTGAGKTSGSGRTLAIKYLKHSFGGLVLTAKSDEVDSWREYCRLAGREDDLIVCENGGGEFFNFLEYESTVQSDRSYAQNLLELLKTVITASQDRANAKSDDAFWENALELFLKNLINLSLLAYGKVTVQLLFDIAQTAPRQNEDWQKPVLDERGQPKPDTPFVAAMKRAKARLLDKRNEWKAQHDDAFLERISTDEYNLRLNDAVPEIRQLQIALQFFTEGLGRIGDKTRGIIDFCLTAFLHGLLDDPIYTLFCNRPSTFTPEDCLNGKIIVINLPVKLYDKVGQDAQTLVKYVFQKAWERRKLAENDRPVFLWADEAQFFLHPKDSIFQTTARSSRVAVVYLSQNLPGFYANMGGDGKKSEYLVKGFLATLSTKIFHANNCIDTNQFASDLIGEAYTEDVTSSSSVGQGFSMTEGSSYSLEKIVRPETFSKLKTGGPANGLIVEAYIHCQGKLFQNDCNHLKIQFTQSQI